MTTKNEATHEAVIQARMAREPAGSHVRDIALLKAGCAEFHASQQTKLLVDYVRLLLAAEKSRAAENRRVGQTVEQHAMSRAIDLWFDAYVSVVAGNKNSFYPLNRMFRRLDARLGPEHPFHNCWRDLLPETIHVEIADRQHREAVASFKPKNIIRGETDFYVAADAPDRPAYERLLADSPQGHFRELLALCRLHVDHWNQVRDPVLVAAFSKLVNAITKQQASMASLDAEYVAPADVDQIGRLLLDLYNADFKPPAHDWREQLAARLQCTADFVKRFLDALTAATAKFDRWHEHGLSLVTQFATIIRAVLDDPGMGRDALMDRFLFDGASTLYVCPTPEG